jgi:hypothetical protein
VDDGLVAERRVRTLAGAERRTRAGQGEDGRQTQAQRLARGEWSHVNMTIAIWIIIILVIAALIKYLLSDSGTKK